MTERIFVLGRGKCLDCGKFLIGALDANGELRCGPCSEKRTDQHKGGQE